MYLMDEDYTMFYECNALCLFSCSHWPSNEEWQIKSCSIILRQHACNNSCFCCAFVFVFSKRCHFQTTTTSLHTRASYDSTTCSCWRHWTSSSQDLSIIFAPKKLSVQWKLTTSGLRWRRSERTRSYCQRSVASLLNSSNCFLMHWTTVDSDMSVTSSLTDHQVCH